MMMASSGPGDRNTFQSLIKEAEKAVADGLYKEAESFYTRAMETDSSNPSLYEGRSSVRIQLQSYEDAIEDAEKSVDLDPEYIPGYFRLGVALQCHGDYSRSIAAFSEGIVRDRKDDKLLNAIVEVSLLSPIKTSLEPMMSQLRKMRYDTDPFVILSVIGQNLLSHDQPEDAAQVLENAVAIGTQSLKLEGSVFSALSSALWSLGDTDRAIYYMNEDLSVSQKLDDVAGQCRAHGNLGVAYFSKANYQLAKENHTKQLSLAQSMQDHKSMGSALSSLGHVHTALNEHKSAMESHKESASIFRTIHDPMSWSKQLGLVSNAYLALGDLDSSLQWQLECLRVTTDEFEAGSDDAAKEEAKVRVDLATVYHKMQKYTEQISCLQKSVDISRRLDDKVTEALTLHSLGYVTRQTGEFGKSQQAYERMLELALSQSNKSLEAKASANLGIVHYQLHDYEMALKLQARNLELSVEFRDVGAQGRAHGNIGNSYSAMGMYDQATQHYLKELEISILIKDKSLECSTHGSLALAYQALKLPEKAFEHFSLQISLACQLKDPINESRAYMNLGNFYSYRKEHRLAIEKYLKYLSIVEKSDFEKPTGVAKACYNVAFAFFSLKDFPNSIFYYDKCLNISLNIQDPINAARAYCNLGLSFRYNGDIEQAFECQQCFLALSTQLQSTKGVFKALGNIGDLYMSCKKPKDAILFYQQQYDIAKKNDIAILIAQANLSLGNAFQFIGDYQRAINCYTEELEIYQQMKDSRNEFRAHGHLGTVLSSLNEFSSASTCYENQCYIAQKVGDKSLLSTALNHMGITAINEQNYEKAIEFFERQLIIVKTIPESSHIRSEILCHIGDCYEVLENYDDAISKFQEAAGIAVKLGRDPLIEKAYCGLCSTYKLVNKPNDAFKYCKLRLETCLRMGNQRLLADSYGEMGFLFTLFAQFENALHCFKNQFSCSSDDPQIRGDASCALGNIHHILRNYQKSLKYHLLDLQIATETENVPCQGRAHGNLGMVYETLHNYEVAVSHQEKHLFIADEQNDPVAKLTALQSIGRNLLRSGSDLERAVLLLQQALLLARELEAKENEGKALLDLSLSYWVSGDVEKAEIHLHEAKAILYDEFWRSLPQGEAFDTSVAKANLCEDLFKELLTCQSALMILYSNLHQHSNAIAAAEELRNLPERVYSKLSKNNYVENSNNESMAQKLSEYAEKHDSVVLYYSMHSGAIFHWLITPDEGVCDFSCQKIDTNSDNDQSDKVMTHENGNSNLLNRLVDDLRDSLGLESPQLEESTKDEIEERQSQEELRLKCFDNTSQSIKYQIFCRLVQTQLDMTVSRNLSVLGVTKSSVDIPKNMKSPVYALHDLLVGKAQEKITKYASKQPLRRLILILEGELVTVPFSLLKRRPNETYLSQQFMLQCVSSANDLLMEKPKSSFNGQYTRAVVVGNTNEEEMDGAFQASQDEANMVSTLLRVEPMYGKTATKNAVTYALPRAECIHFACHLTEAPPYSFPLFPNNADCFPAHEPFSCNSTDSGLSFDNKSDFDGKEIKLTQRSLTMDDIMKFNLSNTKVAVLGSAHFQSTETTPMLQSNSKTTKILTYTRTFLNAGVGALLHTLWPVPETACKLFTRSFYSRLLAGKSTCDALSESIDVLRLSEHFEHPSYWAGFILSGQNMTLDPKNISLYYALRLLLEADYNNVESIITLVLHLIDKTLERIQSKNNTTVPLYAYQASIERKVHSTNGWREFFSAIGFQLQQSSGGIPDAVIFPKVELRDDLLKFKSELISYLHLSKPVLSGFSQLFCKPKIGHALMKSFRKCIEDYAIQGSVDSTRMNLVLSHNIRNEPECSSMLSILGFDVFRIDEDYVMLHCTQDSHDDVSTFFKLLHIFFEFDVDDKASRSDASSTTVSSTQATELQTGSGGLSAVCGLLPNCRRSIAIDFNASFQSQACMDISQRLELPDHLSIKRQPTMTKPTVTQQSENSNTALSSRKFQSSIDPKPGLDRDQNRSRSTDASHPRHATSSGYSTPKNLAANRMCFTDDEQGRSSGHVSHSEDTSSVGSQGQDRHKHLSAFSPVSVNPTHFIPILSPVDHALSVRAPGSIIHPTPRRPKPPSPYIPAPSFASGVLTKTFDYSNIVDKLSRLSSSDLSESGLSSRKSSLQHDTPIKDFIHSLPHNAVCASSVNESPYAGTHGSEKQRKGIHSHIRSLDSSLDDQDVAINPHKHTLSQDGALFYYQRMGLVPGRRRSSTDGDHSRTSSYNSFSSSSSLKRRTDKESPRSRRMSRMSNQSYNVDSPRPGGSPRSKQPFMKNRQYESDSPRNSDSSRTKKTVLSSQSFGSDSPRAGDATKGKRRLIKRNSNHSFGSDSSRSSSHTNPQERAISSGRSSGCNTLPSRFSIQTTEDAFYDNSLSGRRQNALAMRKPAYPSDWTMSASTVDPQHRRIHSLDGNSPRRRQPVDPLSRGYVMDDIPPTSPTDNRESIINRLRTSETSSMSTYYSGPVLATARCDGKFISKTPDPFISHDDTEKHHSNYHTISHRKMASEDRRYNLLENSDPTFSDNGRNKTRRPQPIYMRENENIDELDKAPPDSTLIAWSSAQTTQLPLEEVIKRTAEIQMQRTPTTVSTDSEVTETGTSGYNGSVTLPKTPDSTIQHVRTPIFAYSSGTGNDTESVGSIDRHLSPRSQIKSHIAFV